MKKVLRANASKWRTKEAMPRLPGELMIRSGKCAKAARDENFNDSWERPSTLRPFTGLSLTVAGC